MQNVITDKELDNLHKKYLKLLFLNAYKNVKDNFGIYTFPLYFFHMKGLNSFNIGDCWFYKNDSKGIKEFKHKFPDSKRELIKIIKRYKFKKIKPCFSAIKTYGTTAKCLSEATKQMHIAFVLFKIILHKNGRPKYHDDNYFYRGKKEIDGTFYITIQNIGGIKNTQLAWTEVGNIKDEHSKKTHYYFCDNYFQHVFTSVRSCVSGAFIDSENIKYIYKDLKTLNTFIKRFKNTDIFSSVINAATNFSEARRQTNPIIQVILGTMALEVLAISTKTRKITKNFLNRNTNILFKIVKAHRTTDLKFFMLKSMIDTKVKMKKFIKDRIYRYRSELVHGINREVILSNNNLILNIGSRAIFYAIQLIIQKKLLKIEDFHKTVDKM